MTARQSVTVAVVATMLSCLGCEQLDTYPTLHAAAAAGDIDEVMVFIRRGVDIDALDNHGESALHHAVKYDQPAVALLLIREGATVDRHTKRGRDTPLHYAVMCWHWHIVELLLREGAQEELVNAEGLTARALAIEHTAVENYDAAVSRSCGSMPKAHSR